MPRGNGPEGSQVTGAGWQSWPETKAAEKALAAARKGLGEARRKSSAAARGEDAFFAALKKKRAPVKRTTAAQPTASQDAQGTTRSQLVSAVEHLREAAWIVSRAAGSRRPNADAAHEAAATAFTSAKRALASAQTAITQAQTAVAAARKLEERAAGSNGLPESERDQVKPTLKDAEGVLTTANEEQAKAQPRVTRVTVATELMETQTTAEVRNERLDLLAAEIRDVLTRLLDEVENPANAGPDTASNGQ